MRILRSIAALLIAPPLAFLVALVSTISDLFPRRRADEPDIQPRTDAASIVIPNWNGRYLLAKYLPSVLEATAGNPANEVIVVDNGSEDGSVEFLRETFPTVRVVALENEPGIRRRIERRCRRGEQRYRRPVEQRYARGAGFPCAAAGRIQQ